jgi:hypothetical protein
MILLSGYLLDPSSVLLWSTHCFAIARYSHPRTGSQIHYSAICAKSFFRSLIKNRSTPFQVLEKTLAMCKPIKGDPHTGVSGLLINSSCNHTQSFAVVATMLMPLTKKSLHESPSMIKTTGRWDNSSRPELDRLCAKPQC